MKIAGIRQLHSGFLCGVNERPVYDTCNRGKKPVLAGTVGEETRLTRINDLERNERNKIKILLRSQYVYAILYLYRGSRPAYGLPIGPAACIIAVMPVMTDFFESDLLQHMSAAGVFGQRICVNRF